MIVLFHYGTELLVYRTVKLNAGFLSPLIVGSAPVFHFHALNRYTHYLTSSIVVCLDGPPIRFLYIIVSATLENLLLSSYINLPI